MADFRTLAVGRLHSVLRNTPGKAARLCSPAPARRQLLQKHRRMQDRLVPCAPTTAYRNVHRSRSAHQEHRILYSHSEV